MKPLSLYIHVPFCAAKCAYCDFASYPNRENDWSRYFETVVCDLDRWKDALAEYEIATVFIGGGTPTLVPEEYIVDLLSRVRDTARVSRNAEITVEGNPGTLTLEKLAAYQRAGVNRLSLGAQSFDDRLLRSLGRIHTASQIAEAVRMARDAGFDNINLDLMYALPEQSMEDWRRTVDTAISLEPEHISAYSLIVEEGTPMAARVARGEAVVPEDEIVNAMQRAAVETLSAAGYERYEISNFAKPGRACRHNLVYWQRGDYLGLGCAAHSLMGETRFSNPASLEEYLAGARKTDAQALTDTDIMEETLMLSTRTARGMDLTAWRRRFGADFSQGREARLARLEKAGYIEIAGGFLRLTLRGMELQDAIVVELLD